MWLISGHGATEVEVSCSCSVLVSAHLLYFKSFPVMTGQSAALEKSFLFY